jgi:hypothetical protein
MTGASVKVNMSISNLSSNTNIYKKVSTTNSQPQTIKNTPLNGSIIRRIHNVKPGCGSCGK